jgi:hypothetical protein
MVLNEDLRDMRYVFLGQPLSRLYCCCCYFYLGPTANYGLGRGLCVLWILYAVCTRDPDATSLSFVDFPGEADPFRAALPITSDVA